MSKRDTIERKHQYNAFVVYRDLGYGRTFREVARQTDHSPQTISNWAKMHKWNERIVQHNISVDRKEEVGDLLKIDDPIARKLLKTMDQVEALIDSAFKVDPQTGKPVSKLTIKSADDLTKLLAEHRKFLETYHKFVSVHMPANKEQARSTKIDNLTIQMGEMPQEERIQLMKDIANGDAKGRDQQPASGVQDADFDEVSGPGDGD